ncbi:hypothetical protein BH24ACT15_BH24ACT15_38850 [soil metagenome]
MAARLLPMANCGGRQVCPDPAGRQRQTADGKHMLSVDHPVSGPLGGGLKAIALVVVAVANWRAHVMALGLTAGINRVSGSRADNHSASRAGGTAWLKMKP